MTTDEPILTTSEVADLLKIGRDAVYALVRDEGMPHTRLGKRLRFSRGAVLAWFDARKRTIQPPTPTEPEPKRRGRPRKGVVPGEWDLASALRKGLR